MILDRIFPDYHVGERESGGYGIGFRKNVSINRFNDDTLEEVKNRIDKILNTKNKTNSK